MTTPSSTARAGEKPNKPPDTVHAYVQNSRIHLLQGGVTKPTTYEDAFWTWFSIHDSPYPETKERARQIRAALDEVRNEQHSDLGCA